LTKEWEGVELRVKEWFLQSSKKEKGDRMPDQNGQPMMSDIQLAPIVRTFDYGVVFGGAGNSHLTLDRKSGGFHETTEVPGMRQGERIAIHTDLSFLTPNLRERQTRLDEFL
jgi:hypothetical protein